MEELKIVKKSIKIVSPDEKLNKQLLGMIQSDHDCFGIDFAESYDECKKCTILAELKDKRSPLWEFCKELTLTKKEGGEEPEPEKEEEKEEAEEKGEKEEKEDKEGKLAGLASVAKELLAAGKSAKEVEKEIVKRYLDKGRDEAFALKRAKLYIKLAEEGSTATKSNSKEKEVKEDMARSNSIEWTKSMLKEGKTEEEILAILKKKYMDKGRDEKFAEKRAKNYLKLAKK